MYALYQRINLDGFYDGIWHEPTWHGEEGYDQFKNIKELLDYIHDRNDYDYKNGRRGFFIRNSNGKEEFHEVNFIIIGDSIFEQHYLEGCQQSAEYTWKLFEKEADGE